MANTSRINGFKPVRYFSGAPWNGQARMYVHAAGDNTVLHVGDIVIQGASSTKGYQAVTRATDGTAGGIVGVVVGIDLVHGRGTSLQGTALDLGQTYVLASTERFVWVVDDPMVIFEAEFELGGTEPTQADVGLLYDFSTTAGNTTTGASGMTIDTTAAGATTAATPLKLVGLALRPDNDIVDSTSYQRGLVTINMHVFNDGSVAGV